MTVGDLLLVVYVGVAVAFLARYWAVPAEDATDEEPSDWSPGDAIHRPRQPTSPGPGSY